METGKNKKEKMKIPKNLKDLKSMTREEINSFVSAALATLKDNTEVEATTETVFYDIPTGRTWKFDSKQDRKHAICFFDENDNPVYPLASKKLKEKYKPLLKYIYKQYISSDS